MADPRTDHPQPDERDHLAPVPEDNRPGHHPDVEQDKPDRKAFVERFNHAGEEADDGQDGDSTRAEMTERARSAVGTARSKATDRLPSLRDVRSMAARSLRRLADLLEPDSERQSG